MKRERYLRRRLHTLHALNEAVSAMKSLSAHHFLQCRQALPAARAYRDEIELAIADIGVTQALDADVPTGLLLIVSDLGLCGDYNTRLVQAAVDAYRKEGQGPIYCVGRRPRATLAGAGMTLPGELARVTGLSRRDAGRGNRALVAEGYAITPAPGVYRLVSR